MAEIISVIEPAPGSDGPYVVVTRKNASVTNVTTGLSNLVLALDQAKADQAAVLTGSYLSTTITTQTTG